MYSLINASTTTIIWAPSSEFVSSSIPSWHISTAHALPFRGAGDLAFCLKVPLDSLLVWASSEGSGETARMRRLAWTFAARIGDKYQIRLTRSICKHTRSLFGATRSHCYRNNQWVIIIITFKIVSSWQNHQNDMCALRRLRSAWASSHSDQSCRSPQEPKRFLAIIRTYSEDSGQTERMHCVGFIVRWLFLLINA